jgi:hypothetical protein
MARLQGLVSEETVSETTAGIAIRHFLLSGLFPNGVSMCLQRLLWRKCIPWENILLYEENLQLLESYVKHPGGLD